MKRLHDWGLPECLQHAGVTALDIWTFMVAAVSFVEVTVIGRLFISEILLLLSLPWLWSARDRPRLPRWFVVVWAGWLASQVVTDLVVGSAYDDYLRGWAGIAFTFTNFAAILILVSTPMRARVFAVGLAVAGLLGFLIAPYPAAAADPWKWALAMPVGLILVAAVSGRVGARLPWLAVAVLAAFGMLNLLLGFRTLAGVGLIAAGYLALSAVVGRWQPGAPPSTRRAILGLTFVALAGLSVLGIYSVAASQGLLGHDAEVKFSKQAGAFGAIIGGRPEVLASSQAILDSPILGHGSWAKDPKYAALLVERQKAMGYAVTPEYVGAELIPTHSHLLGAWVWAGFLGAVFWCAVALVAVWLLANLYSAHLEVAPLLIFLAILLLWDIAFSPYASSGRITAPYALVLCLLGLRLMREQRGARIVAGAG